MSDERDYSAPFGVTMEAPGLTRSHVRRHAVEAPGSTRSHVRRHAVEAVEAQISAEEGALRRERSRSAVLSFFMIGFGAGVMSKNRSRGGKRRK